MSQVFKVKEADQTQILTDIFLSQKLLFFLFRCTANGNCLYNSCSLLLNGEEDLCHLLKGLVNLELLVQWDYYTRHPYILAKIYMYMKSEGYLFGMALSKEATQQLNTSLE